MQLLEDIAAAYTALSSNFEIRVIVMAGRGKSFCAGADLKVRPRLWACPCPSPACPTLPLTLWPLWRKNGPAYGLSKPTFRELRYGAQCWRRAGAAIMGNDAITIGRVHGHASGGGCGMMMVNDLVVCEESTRIWLPEVELGTPMIGGLTPVLAHIIVRPHGCPCC